LVVKPYALSLKLNNVFLLKNLFEDSNPNSFSHSENIRHYAGFDIGFAFSGALSFPGYGG